MTTHEQEGRAGTDKIEAYWHAVLAVAGLMPDPRRPATPKDRGRVGTAGESGLNSSPGREEMFDLFGERVVAQVRFVFEDGEEGAFLLAFDAPCARFLFDLTGRNADGAGLRQIALMMLSAVASTYHSLDGVGPTMESVQISQGGLPWPHSAWRLGTLTWAPEARLGVAVEEPLLQRLLALDLKRREPGQEDAHLTRSVMKGGASFEKSLGGASEGDS
ncbi:hypothetical protein [Pararhodospirillum oryzae]|uniref:hypothetical protein n=1 Tax=Pararhodospirillum oryzae TaxID=478448 RepID=UPI0011BEAE09|nr:hypothetical protein [Pararhodospirillum oryzae]